MLQGEVFDHHRGFRHHLPVIDKKRDLAGRPQLHKGFTLRRVSEIDGDRLEGQRQLVKGNRDFLAIGRQRVCIELQSHVFDSIRRGRGNGRP